MDTRTYRERTGRIADFRVRYAWLPQLDQARPQRLFQHMRCDWLYQDDDPARDGISMIWPEFEDEGGRALPKGAAVTNTGLASMWIVNPDMKTYHRSRVRIGAGGFLVAGHNRIASAEVIELLALTNEGG